MQLTTFQTNSHPCIYHDQFFILTGNHDYLHRDIDLQNLFKFSQYLVYIFNLLFKLFLFCGQVPLQNSFLLGNSTHYTYNDFIIWAEIGIRHWTKIHQVLGISFEKWRTTFIKSRCSHWKLQKYQNIWWKRIYNSRYNIAFNKSMVSDS